MLQKTREERETLKNKEPFNRETRCDQCRAQAYYSAYKIGSGSELFFCIHHYNKNEIGLMSAGFEIDDRSWALTA